MLEDNHRTLCSLNQIVVPENFDIKEKIASILEESGFAERRSRTMDIDDFLKLLTAFNKENIRFA